MMVPPKNNMMIRGETKKSHIFVNQLTPNDLQKYVNQKLRIHSYYIIPGIFCQERTT